jgi:protoporphyrinogen oxidase
MRSAIQHMIWPPRESDSPGRIRTLINEFDYPRLGPGMMWDRMADLTTAAGGRIQTETAVVGLRHDGTRMRAVDVESGGVRETLPAGHVISTMPIRDLIGAISPAPPTRVIEAANRLKYRDFLTVALVFDVPVLFPDNWIYVHDESVKVGRIQNFKNWSPDMVPDASQTCLGLEYFCFENDGLWSLSDAELIALGTREVAQLGLADPRRVVDGAVVRVRKAYPVYDDGFVEALAIVRDYLSRFENLQLVGRNGMHKYNNQDHSMLTAILAVRNLFGAEYDIWALNSDDEYQEDVAANDGFTPDHELDLRDVRLTQPHVPRPLSLERDR